MSQRLLKSPAPFKSLKITIFTGFGGHFEDSARGTTQVYILQMYRFLPKPPEYLAQ